MTATQTAKATARNARNTRVLEVLTRIGFVGYGLFHLAIAWLALQIALGRPTGSGDQSGAFHLLRNQPAGEALVIIVLIGLIAMAVWQLLLAIIGTDAKERLMSVGRTIVYGFLAWTAYKVATGKSTSSSEQQRDTTATVLRHGAGQWLVGMAGVVVVVIAIAMVAYGVKRSFTSKLKLDQMSPRTRAVVTRLAQVGYISKGVALAIVGILVIDVAWLDDAARSSGLDAALHTLTRYPFGVALLVVIALGFAAHGVYCFCRSRYCKI